MKIIKSLIVLPLLAVGSISAAWAGHGHSHVSVGISVGMPVYSGYYGPRYYGPRYYGSAYYGPRYYGSPYYGAPYYPGPVYATPVVVSQPVVMQPQQQVYVERPQQASGVQPYENSPYWYFCSERNAYYPYVKSCPSAWQQVTPTPPSNP